MKPEAVVAGALPWSLVGLVHLLDRADPKTMGTVRLALHDEPAHLATSVLVLLALCGPDRMLARPVATTVACASSMLIDIDHVPLYLTIPGLPDVAVDNGRPFTHSLSTIAALGGLAAAWRLRRVSLGRRGRWCGAALRTGHRDRPGPAGVVAVRAQEPDAPVRLVLPAAAGPGRRRFGTRLPVATPIGSADEVSEDNHVVDVAVCGAVERSPAGDQAQAGMVDVAVDLLRRKVVLGEPLDPVHLKGRGAPVSTQDRHPVPGA